MSSNQALSLLNMSPHHDEFQDHCFKADKVRWCNNEVAKSFKDTKRTNKIIKIAISKVSEEKKLIKCEIETNLDLAKERISFMDKSSSWRANKIVAVLAMHRVLMLESKLATLKILLYELKELRDKVETNILKHDDVEAKVKEIIIKLQTIPQEHDMNRSKLSDDQLIELLNRRILKQQIQCLNICVSSRAA